jgi:hypothetical protein
MSKRARPNDNDQDASAGSRSGRLRTADQSLFGLSAIKSARLMHRAISPAERTFAGMSGSVG